MLRVADYIVERLYEQGVKDIFMVTGRGILYLTDAVARKEDLNAISVHHEQAAAYAAAAYAQKNEKIGACLTSTGCGSTNAITGVLCAWQDSVPCVFISGQNMLQETTRYTGVPIRTYGSQEADIISLVEPITKYAVMLTDAEDVAYEIDKALYYMNEGRKGPVWIDVPLDIQNMRVEPEELRRFSVENSDKHDCQTMDIEYVCNCLSSAERPVILVGNGVRMADAVKQLTELVHKINIPVVYAPSASDIYGSGNELGIGSVGSLGGTREGNFAIQNSDFILAIGCSLATVLTGDIPEKFARKAKLAVVDIDEFQHTKKGVKIDRLIISDAKEFLCRLLECDISETPSQWVEKCIHWKNIFPLGKEKYADEDRIDLYYLAEVLSEHLTYDTTVVCDAGFEELIIPAAVHYKEKQRCIHPAAQGAMGYALPASMGAYLAQKTPVVAVVGDGSIMMNLQELQTIFHYGLPIKILIINNNVYSVIRRRQRDLFRTRTIGTNPDNGVSCPDFSKVADCFGILYKKISNNGELKAGLQEVMKSNEAVLCEINCMEEQRYLHASIARNSQKRVVKRPLEDMSPFLDRDIFLKEMVIEPIDQ